MPYREEVNFIAVDDEMPDHEKIEPLSDAAFRLIVTTWCYCNKRENDGVIPARLWKRRGNTRTRTEVETAGLVRDLGDGRYEVHDYLDMQRAAQEIAALKVKRSEAAKKGNHRRHHVLKGVVAPDCELCRKETA